MEGSLRSHAIPPDRADFTVENFAVSLAVSRTHRRSANHRLENRLYERPTRDVWALVILGVLSLGLVIVLATAVALVAWFGRYAGALPPPDKLTAQAPFQTTKVLAADGSTDLFDITDPNGGRRTIVQLNQMPRHLIEAVIATEDAGFYSNPGFELHAIVRAGIEDLSHQHIVSGASTITQQVVRNVLLSPSERASMSASRKIKEIILAYQLTQTYTKDQILSVYLNEIPYGNHSFGIEAASEGYFGKHVWDLDLAECALLAGLPQAPSYYDPYLHLDAAKQRQKIVLQRMVDQGYITEAQAQAAAAEPLHFVDNRHAVVAPHFVNYVSGILQQELGKNRLYHDGDRVISTLDLPLQKDAEQVISRQIDAKQRQAGENVALVAIDPQNGHILAMVGSANYEDPAIAGEVNQALAYHDSAGVLSPLTYALALEQGKTLVSRIQNSTPSNVLAGASGASNTTSAGTVTLRQALGRSLDAPVNQLIAEVGNQKLIDLATAIGLTNFGQHVQYGQNLTIASARVSPLQVAQVYAMLANQGKAVDPIAIDRVIAPNGTIVKRSATKTTSVLDPGIAYLISNVLTDPGVRPSIGQQALKIGHPVAVHFGASQASHDAWVAGYVPNLAVVVWMTEPQGTSTDDTQHALDIWGSFVQEALKQRPPTDFVMPSDITQVSLCQNPVCSIKQSEVVLRSTQGNAEAANAAAMGKSSAPLSASQTPLVNRNRASAVTAPVTTQTSHVGSAPVTVPNVTGITPDVARERLAAAGLDNAPLIKYVSGDSLPAATVRRIGVGQVISTSPQAGARVPPKTNVVLTVRRN